MFSTWRPRGGIRGNPPEATFIRDEGSYKSCAAGTSLRRALCTVCCLVRCWTETGQKREDLPYLRWSDVVGLRLVRRVEAEPPVVKCCWAKTGQKVGARAICCLMLLNRNRSARQRTPTLCSSCCWTVTRHSVHWSPPKASCRWVVVHQHLTT